MPETLPLIYLNYLLISFNEEKVIYFHPSTKGHCIVLHQHTNKYYSMLADCRGLNAFLASAENLREPMPVTCENIQAALSSAIEEDRFPTGMLATLHSR